MKKINNRFKLIMNPETESNIDNIIKQMIQAEIQNRIEEIKSVLMKEILIENKPFLTLHDVAQLTGLKKTTLYTYMNKGLITYYRPNSKHVFFRLSDVNDLIFRNKSTSKAQIEREALSIYLKSRI